MEKISRENLLKKYNEVNNAIAELDAKEYLYKTDFNTLKCWGHVADIATLEDCVKAAAYLKSRCQDLANVATELGVDINNDVDPEYCGIKTSVWMEDIKTRIMQLKDAAKLQKLEDAVKILRRNLSEDDKFTLDMSNVEELLA